MNLSHEVVVCFSLHFCSVDLRIYFVVEVCVCVGVQHSEILTSSQARFSTFSESENRKDRSHTNTRLSM